jgi:TolB-like protein/Tfp pilus assembly protein PilF
VIGLTLAHYRITAALGAGGMGEVWRAEDTKLGREVALKVLSEEFASDPQRLDRFEREARAVAALNHPHIVTIHSVEEAEGVRFLTMELIEGRSLEKLIPEMGLEIDSFFELATPLAEAISAAHDKSVIHRDLKPSNVMVDSDGRVKVLDFGLAKLQGGVEVSDSSELPTEALTGVGMIVGTVPYMSPEQIEGEIVDYRTDIFSLGVLLYEMAVGERPFRGKSSPSLMSSILKDAPTPVVELRTDLPRHLGRIIGRCLEKDRRNRYQTARDVFNELKALRRESSSPAVSAAQRPGSDGVAVRTMRPSSDVGASETALRDEGFWVAVLPFKFSSGDADLSALAEGLSEDIVTGLSRFSYLRVVSHGSAQQDSVTVRDASDASYVMEGSLRHAGDRLRIAVQLVEAATGAHLWAETYDRTFSPEALFDLQDDLGPQIVSTVADMHGILPRRMSETVGLKPADQLTPYEALLHSFGYNERFTPEALAEARTCLERAVEQSPENADCWAMLSVMYSNEFGHWDNRDPDYFDKALRAARKAVLAAPLHSLPHYALAQAHFFRREFPEARTAAERAVALNTMDGSTAAFMGLLIAYSGEWERGCFLAERALELNPNLPGMFHYTAWHDAYRKEDYRRALELALKLNTPGSFYQHAVLAMCYAQLGEMDSAHKSLREMLALKPDYGQVARQLHGKWIQPDLVEKLMDGLRKAGLEIGDKDESGDVPAVHQASGEQRADEGFWVAVLPFDYAGGDPDITSLAEGLSGDIVTGLSRFSYLRVISRGSTLQYAGDGADIRSAGQELGARYVMEGTLRQAGNTLRVAVQLVDATTGAHLWAENYQRTLDAETIFEVQDDLVPRIVSTVADWYGALPHSMSEAVRLKPSDQLTSYEAVLRSFGYFGRINPEEHAIVRAGLERAVEQSPGDAYGWAMLSMIYGEEHRFGFNAQPDPLERSLHAARRAVDAAHANNIAWLALAQALFFRKEFDAFHDAAERAIALNNMDGSTLEYVGHLMAFAGSWDRGCEVSERARQLNPNHPGWYWVVHFLDAYRKDDYQAARDYGLKAHHRGGGARLFEKTLLAALYGQLGVEQLMDGLRKAGLEVVPVVDQASGEQRADEGFWVAVLPFKYTGSDEDLNALAEGLSEDIVTGLSRFSYLRVIARGSATTGARYVMEGSLRRAGKKLRVAAQLVDTVSGAHLWAETYDRDFDPEGLFDLQDDLVPRIVSTCADHFGVLARAISEAVRGKPVAELTPYEALMRGFGYHFRLSPEEHAQAREALERAVEQDPGNADCQAMLAWVCAHEVAHGFNPRPGSLDRALAAARKAVDLAPSNHLAQQVLAVVLFFRGETAACRSACERALALNPLDGSNEAIFLTCFTGDWERGCALIRRAMELNPHHPRWYVSVLALDEYRKENYQGAVEAAITSNAVDLFWTHWLLAAAYGQLGEQQAASRSLDDLLAQKPDFAETGRQILCLWFQPELAEHFVAGLGKAGLDLGSGEQPASALVSPEEEGGRISVAPSIAVLPFINRSDDSDNEFFSDGLTEELISDLAGIKALSVISLTSAMLFKGSEKDLPTIGRELGVRYVLEGSVRKAGSSLRITAQLVDAEKDSPLWSDKYTGTIDDVFEVQERVSREIVRALDVTLTSDESRRLAERPIADARAFELYLQARQEIRRFDMKALDRAEKILSQAVEIEGATPPLVYLMALAKVAEAKAGVNPDPHQLEEAEAQALVLLEDTPDLPQAHALLGSICYERGHQPQAVWHCKRALEGSSNDAEAFLYLGASYMAAGQPELGLDAGQRMVACDPLASISWMILGAARWFVGRAEDAVPDLERSLELDPQNFLSHWGAGYTYALVGRLEDARRHADICLEIAPENAYAGQVASLVDALEGRREAALERLAGLDIGPLDPHNTFHISESFAMAGDTARALEVLESAVDEGFYPYPYFNEYCPFMEPLRFLPEYAAILQKAKERTESFREDGPLRPSATARPGAAE